MLPGMELMGCQIDVPASVMHHVVKVESSYNPYAIGVVGGRLLRQPTNLAEAVATAEMLAQRGYNFSLGLAQVNRYNLSKYGLQNYAAAFQVCPNLRAGARILRECHGRANGHWGRAFSCYYSGNFTTGYRHGYVQKVEASMRAAAPATGASRPGLAIPVVSRNAAATRQTAPVRATPIEQRATTSNLPSLLERRAGLAAARLPPAAQLPAETVDSQPGSDVSSPMPAPSEPFQVRLSSEVQPQSGGISRQPQVPARQVRTEAAGKAVADSAFVF